MIAGHGRLDELRAKQDAGEAPPDGVRVRGTRWYVPVVHGWASADDAEALAYLVTSNESTIAGGWDYPKLGSALDEVRTTDLGLVGTGYTADRLDDLLGQLARGALDAERGTPGDTPPADLGAAPGRASLGDVWTCGPHRLHVGDARDPAAYTAVMAGELADLVWTDPPYGISYQTDLSPEQAKALRRRTDGKQIQNDALEGPALRSLLSSTFKATLEVCRPGSGWFVTAPAVPALLEFLVPLHELGIWRQIIVWVKDRLVLGRSDYHGRCELLIYGWTPGAAHTAPMDRTWDTVWEIPRPSRSVEHPTMKPVELVTRSILNHSTPGATVLDPYAGSGTTMIACAETGRVARCIELDPQYADVILDRWERHSGETAAKVDQ